jgi:ADP-heptose:LPS heptosyltransferase
LERIGDLLMSAPAIASVRQFAPTARIELVVGSWNASLARLIPGIDSVETLDAPWLARGADGATNLALLQQAWHWRARHYDLAINFEGDIRSHGLMALSGAPRRVGFDMAGGGPLLTTRVPFSPDEHTTENAWRLVRTAFNAGAETRTPFRLLPSVDAAKQAEGLLAPFVGRPIIAVHASGGRAIKQWPVGRFAEVAARVAIEENAVLLLTGTTGDRGIVDEVRRALPSGIEVLDLVGEVDLPVLAAMLSRCRLLITGDTGPMHLAAAVGTPIVAVFGPSMPWRYAPISAPHRVVRIDLPCAPCNRIRLPPVRCQGHTPDCLEGVTVDLVHQAARSLLLEAGTRNLA